MKITTEHDGTFTTQFRQSDGWWLFAAHPSELQVCVLSRPSCCVISFSKGCQHPHLSRNPPPTLSLTFYLDITLACISANVNSEWMSWDVEVNDDALTAVYIKLSEGCLKPQSHFTRTSSLKSIRWLGLNLGRDTHILTGWELQSLHSRLLTTQSFSRLLDPHAFQIVFAKVKCNVQLAGSDGVNGEDGVGGWGGPTLRPQMRKEDWSGALKIVLLSPLCFFPPLLPHNETMAHIIKAPITSQQVH